jgi:PAS domain S-box-containing protein
MPSPLRVLVVEDSEFDARMLIRLLNRGGYETEYRRVETAGELREALKEDWDLVLSDYNLPEFKAPEALAIYQELNLDMPFIIISGGIGEDIAVASMKAGAHDYLMKGNLARLVPAVERELREYEVRRARRRAVAELRESEERYRLLWETATDAILLMDNDSVIRFANPAVEVVFGYRPEEVVGRNMTLLLPAESSREEGSVQLFKSLSVTDPRSNRRMVETVGRRKGDEMVLIEVVYNEMRIDGQSDDFYVAFIRDITERKRAEKELMEHQEQFRVAREIQQHLFPKESPSVPGFDIAGASFPAEAAGGDYYDYLEMANGRFGLVVGDVTGHGVGPALLMAETRAYVRIVALNRDDVGRILTRANDALSDDIGDERYVTMFLGRLDADTRTLYYCSAGHPPALIIGRDGALRAKLKRTGVPLGMRRKVQYQAAEPVVLEPGDILALLTDGADEATNEAGDFFGLEEVIRVIREHRDRPAAEIVQAIYEEVRAYAVNPQDLDDVTAIIVKVDG